MRRVSPSMRRVSPSQQGEALRTMRSPAVFIVVAVTALVAPGWLPSVLGVLPTNQRDALVSLYSATGGAGWTTSTNWLTGDPCTNNWVGVLCSGTTSLACVPLLLTYCWFYPFVIELVPLDPFKFELLWL